jgi:hypothetical protein
MTPWGHPFYGGAKWNARIRKHMPTFYEQVFGVTIDFPFLGFAS